MGYDTWLEGTLALEPFPDPDLAGTLRAALAAPRDPRAGRLDLTPLGRGVVCEGAFDWEVALAALREAHTAIFRPAGVELLGTLRALGEDGAHLATVFVGGGAVRVERYDGDDGPTPEDWIEALRGEDPELRREAAVALAEADDPRVVEALAAAARGDAVEAVRCRALESLGGIGPGAAGALSTVASCLQDPSPFVRTWATFAAGRLGPAAASTVPALERLAGEEAEGPRYGALDALRRIRG